MMTMPAKGEKVVVCVFFVVSMASLTFGGPINDVLSGLSAEDNDMLDGLLMNAGLGSDKKGKATSPTTMDAHAHNENEGVTVASMDQASGFPTYRHQQEMLSQVATFKETPNIQRLEPTVSYDAFVARYLPTIERDDSGGVRATSHGELAIIKKGMLDAWPALSRWTRAGLYHHHRCRTFLLLRNPIEGETVENITGREVSQDPLAGAGCQDEDGFGDLPANMVQHLRGVQSSDRRMTMRKYLDTVLPVDPDLLANTSRCHAVDDTVADEHGHGAGPDPDPTSVPPSIDVGDGVCMPDVRNVFNQVALDTPLGSDVVVPPIFKKIGQEKFQGGFHCDGTDISYVDFILGPALSGAHIHVHDSAWNGLVFGRRRWFVLPWGVRQDGQAALRRNKNNTDAWTFFSKLAPKWRKQHKTKVIEFVQEAGEVVFIPHNWPYAVINLAPSVAVSQLFGSLNFPDYVEPDAQ